MKNVYIPIAVYKYNNNKYYILSVNNEINCIKFENGKMSKNFCEEELKLFYAVHKSMKINTDNSMNLGIHNIKGKDFQLYYDRKNNLYYWNRLLNGKIVKPTINENKILNYKYNNIKLSYSDTEIYDWANDDNINGKNDIKEKNKENIKNKINRIVKFGTKAVIVTIIAGVNFIAYSNTAIAQNLKTKLQGIVGIEESANYDINDVYDLLENYECREYDYQQIASAIEKNKNLSTQEKEFLYKLKFVFDENYKYMDIDGICDKFSDLKIEYVQEPSSREYILGEYAIDENKITIYNTKDFNECDPRLILHELLHVTQRHGSSSLCLELSNELFTREVVRYMVENGLLEDSQIYKNSLGFNSEYGIGYSNYMSIEYLLANVLTQEQMKKFQFNPYDTILIDALSDIETNGVEDDEKGSKRQAAMWKATNLLSKINEIYTEDENGVFVSNLSYVTYKDIYNSIDNYYKIKYGKSMTESLQGDIYKYDDSFVYTSIGEYDYISAAKALNIDNVPEIGKNGNNLQSILGKKRYVLPKTYFSNEHEYPIIMVSCPNQIAINVDDEIEKNYTEYYKDFRKKQNQDNLNYYSKTDNAIDEGR